jgi:uncharacterized protein (TIGR02452 family)
MPLVLVIILNKYNIGSMSTKKENIAIWKDTIKRFIDGEYVETKTIGSIVYDGLPLIHGVRYQSTHVDVINMDTLSCCHMLVEKGYNVMGLNMASPSNPGGGVCAGSFAQEENCFRRSNYFQTLIKLMYPIKETSCIYSFDITVIKDKNYKLLDEPFKVAMVACAGLRHPQKTSDGKYLNERDRKLMKYKIQQIFQVGYLRGHDTLVLGAFGAGAFGNPSSEVAQLFNEVMVEYSGCFEQIIFAIIDYKDDNYNIFDKLINKK